MTKEEFKNNIAVGSIVTPVRSYIMTKDVWQGDSKKVKEGTEYTITRVDGLRAYVNQIHYFTPSTITFVDQDEHYFDKQLEKAVAKLKREIAAREQELTDTEDFIRLRGDFPKLDIRQKHITTLNKLVDEFPNEKEEKLIKLAIKL